MTNIPKTLYNKQRQVIYINTNVLSNLIINNVISVHSTYTNHNIGSTRHNRPSWAIIIKYEGETVYTVGGKEYISNINNITIIPKGCTYAWKCIKAGRYFVAEFDCETVSREIFSFPVKNGEAFLNILKKMEHRRTMKDASCHLDELSDLYSVISMLVKTKDQQYLPSSNFEKLLPVTDYIAKNYYKNICNEDLAKIAGISTVYFRKLFKNAYGISPISYIQSIKIKRAKEMLESDYSSITDIAYSLGYSNIYDFSRSFKKQVGLSPSQYEKQLQK